MRTLDFFFDYISNNAYLAWTQLHTLQQEHKLTIRPTPVLFAGLLKAHNNVGPAEIRAKREWMSKNILRKAQMLNVPLQPPKFHPFNPLLALRASSLDMPEENRWQLIDGIFKAIWVDQQHVSEPDVICTIANKAGLDGVAIVKAAQTPAASQCLKQQTAKAVERGTFGIPTMMVDDELFFGYDDFVYLAMYLQDQDPLDKDAFAQWNPDLVQASATRKERNQADT